MIKVLFVCLGNICRSPIAHGVFRTYVEREGLTSSISVDSAGTGDWHIGAQPDRRAQQVALDRGYDISDLRARQVRLEDFSRFDCLLAMDMANRKELLSLAPNEDHAKVQLLMEFASKASVIEVPDPYYGSEQHFVEVLEMVEDAAVGLLQDIRSRFVI